MASRGVTTVPIFYIDTDGTMYDTTTDELLYGNNNKYDAEESRLRLAHVLRNRKQQQQQQQQPLLSTTTTTTATCTHQPNAVVVALKKKSSHKTTTTVTSNPDDDDDENTTNHNHDAVNSINSKNNKNNTNTNNTMNQMELNAAVHTTMVVENVSDGDDDDEEEHGSNLPIHEEEEEDQNAFDHDTNDGNMYQDEWDDDDYDTDDDDDDEYADHDFNVDDENSDVESNTNLMTPCHSHPRLPPTNHGEQPRNALPGAGRSRMMTESHQQQQRRYATSLVERDQQLKMNQMMARSHIRNMRPNRGNSIKALPSQFVYQPSPADNAAARAIVHHTGSHYHMAGSKQFQRGVRVKGVVARHSQQGAKLQAARMAQRNMYEAREDARGERAAGAGKNQMKQSKKSKKKSAKSNDNE